MMLAAGPRRLTCSAAMMPVLLQDIARLTSPELALRFARHFGNTRLYIPRRIAAGHPLARCLGLRAAERLCAALGGETQIVPRATPLLRWLDARALCVLGLSRGEAALRLGIGPRHMRKLLAGFSPDGIEIDPFVLSIGRQYGVNRSRRGAVMRAPESVAQTDFGWAPACCGMRLTAG